VTGAVVVTATDPGQVGPGLAGFLAVFALALATWLLFRSMNRHLRNVRYRGDEPGDGPGPTGRGSEPGQRDGRDEREGRDEGDGRDGRDPRDGPDGGWPPDGAGPPAR
jgi:hypothetical protein